MYLHQLEICPPKGAQWHEKLQHSQRCPSSPIGYLVIPNDEAITND